MNTATTEPEYKLPPGYGLAASEAIDSTNDEAKRWAVNGMSGPHWFVAGRQTAGRGRRGRAWASEPGNLYASLLLRPDCAVGEAALLSFAAVLAVAEAIEEVTGLFRKLTCKWPNDALYEGKKISGILLESASDRDGALDWLVIGVGVNVAHFPDHTDFPATSIAAEGYPGITAPDLFTALARRLDHWLKIWRQAGFAPVREAWLARAAGLGEAITARTASEEVHGRFAGLSPEGALLIEAQDGAMREILAGDVFPANTGA